MNQQQNQATNIDQFRIFQLFPPRTQIPQIDIKLDKYKKLYQQLCCIFCKQIFSTPIYLKCSHRFCRDCIQTYIRLNQKILCPLCQYQLINKKDFKIDHKLILLINSIFNNIIFFKQSIYQYQTHLYHQLIKSKQQQLFKKQRYLQPSQIKSKIIQPANRKRTKKSSSQNIDNIKNKNTQKNKYKNSIQQHKNIISLPQQQNYLHPPQSKSTPLKPIKAAKVQQKINEIIEIYSQDQQFIQQSSPSKIKINQNIIQQQYPQNKSYIYQPSQFISNHLKSLQTSIINHQHIEDNIINARQKLKLSLKQSYFTTLILKSQQQCSICISLRRRPKFSLSPSLNLSTIQLSLQTNLIQLKKFILYKLKIPQIYYSHQIVTIYILSHCNLITKITDDNINILTLLQKYWKYYKGLTTLAVSQVIQQKNEKKINTGQNRRVLYYLINLKQISKKMQTPTMENK